MAVTSSFYKTRRRKPFPFILFPAALLWLCAAAAWAEPTAYDSSGGAEGVSRARPAAAEGPRIPADFTFNPSGGFYLTTRDKLKDQDVLRAIPMRAGFGLKFGFNWGGEGYVFELTPGLAFDKEFAELQLYLSAIKWRFSLMSGKLDLACGVGIQGGYLFAEQIDIGMDIFPRLPLTATYYFRKDFGVDFNLAFGYGFTGIKYRGNQTLFNAEKNPNFGVGAGALLFEAMVGVQLP